MDKKQKNTENGKLHTENSASPYRNDGNSRTGDLRRGDAKKKKSYGTRPVKGASAQRTPPIRLNKKPTEADKKRRIEKERKNERLRNERIRAGLGLCLAIVLAIVLIFMTPLFNIKEIRLNGNEAVTKEVITAKVGDLIGANLFSTSSSIIEKEMTEIAQIREVKVRKGIFPARLELDITESKPAGYVLCGKTILVIDSDLRIIDDANMFDYEKLPSISGISVSEYELNERLNVKSEEKKEILLEMLKAFEACALTDLVKFIGVDDITAITFNYDNRIDVLCGSRLQLDRKIRMFSESIKTSTFDENSIGSVDLSTPGTALYKP